LRIFTYAVLALDVYYTFLISTVDFYSVFLKCYWLISVFIFLSLNIYVFFDSGSALHCVIDKLYF